MKCCQSTVYPSGNPVQVIRNVSQNSKHQVNSNIISDCSEAISNTSLKDQSNWRIGDSMHNPLSLNWSYPTISTREMGEEVLLRASWGNTEEESSTQIMCKYQLICLRLLVLSLSLFHLLHLTPKVWSSLMSSETNEWNQRVKHGRTTDSVELSNITFMQNRFKTVNETSIWPVQMHVKNVYRLLVSFLFRHHGLNIVLFKGNTILTCDDRSFAYEDSGLTWQK